MKLCCFLNYPPLYRESIFRRLDETFDCRFYFGRSVEGARKSGIARLDLSIFKHKPVEFANIKKGRLLWRRKLLQLAFADFDAYLLTWDTCLSYPLFMLIARLRGKKIYAWGHGVKDNTHPGWPLDRWMIKRLDGFFTYGERGRKRMIELGFPPEKIHTIGNSLGPRSNGDIDGHLESDILRRRFGNDLPTVLFIGRLNPSKRLDRIIEMAAEHRAEGIDYNLLIIGDGPVAPLLKARADELGINDRTWFFGECYDESVLNTLIYNSDLCCSPGNVGLTALHAMTYGVPVVTHDDFEHQAPEYEIITPGVTGDLFKYGDWDDLAAKVAGWLSSHSTPEARAQARRDCRAAIDGRWNSDAQIEIFREFIR